MAEEKSTEEKEVERYKAFLARAENNLKTANRQLTFFNALTLDEGAVTLAALDRTLMLVAELEAKFDQEPGIDVWGLANAYETLVKARVKMETTLIRTRRAVEIAPKRWEKELDRLKTEHPDGRVVEDAFPF